MCCYKEVSALLANTENVEVAWELIISRGWKSLKFQFINMVVKVDSSEIST